MSEMHLAVEEVAIGFGGVKALDGVSLAARKGSITSIIGPNGAGKTSLINCISGRYIPQQGRILFEGRDITRMPPPGGRSCASPAHFRTSPCSST